MSLYHDQSNIPFPLPHDAADHLYHPNVDNGHAQGSPSTDTTRFCSVRGCTAPLSPEYPHKMCEACRERHRVYASTKRAKRKMEKSVLNAQTGVSWMPTDGDGGDPGPAASDHPLPEEAQIAISSQHATAAYEYTEDPWTTDPVDLRLLSKTVSELEMALTYPYRTFSSSSGAQSSAPVPNSQVASSSTAPFSFIPSTSTPIVPPAAQASPGAKGEISVRNISAVASQAESALPPRYCSIKGCKTVVDGGSLFKMCDSCRMKYKGYGTTKRKKWKEEKTKALAELERQREEENKIRADNGLPPLSPNERLTWLDGEIGGLRVVNTSIPRMCTVSHCREILAVGYQYLRCERHRIQNRHHSKLKRVRDKSSKAQALEEWYATVADDMPDATLVHTLRDRHSHSDDLFADEDAEEDEEEDSPAFEFHGPEEHRDAVAHDINMVEPQVIVFGVPPAARGVRRTNHSCSVKGCFNLLSPTTPWKMCDQCRAHERSVRKVRAMRESGIDVEPLPPRRLRERREPKDKTKQSAKKKGKQKEIDPQPSESPSRSVSRDRTTESSSNEREGSVLVFMDPIVPEEQPPAVEQRRSVHSASFVATDGAGNATAPTEGSQTTFVTHTPVVQSSTNGGTEDSNGKQKKGKKKKGAAASSTHEAAAGAAGSSVSNGASTSVPVSTAAPQTLPVLLPPPPPSAPGAPPPPHPYAVPYYPPAPYATPYFQGAPYPYAPPLPPFTREGFAPSAMYQPPFPGMYPPYPIHYYPHPYGQHPYAPPPPGMMMGPPVDPSAGMSESASAPALQFAQMPPPPPPDPSTMYGVFSTRTSTRKASDSGATPNAATDPPPESSPPPLMITSAPGKEPVYSQVIAGEAPLRRKRRKADYEAVAAFQKRRQEESIAKAQASANNANMSLPPPVMPVSRAPEIPEPDAPMNVDPEPVIPASSTLAEVDDRNPPKLCASKACHRSLSPADTGSICSRCKDRIKKHALKVKKRYKLVPSATHVPVTKKVSSSVDHSGPDDVDAQPMVAS